MLDIVLVGPFGLVLDEGIHEGDDLSHAASVGCGEGPEIVLRSRERLADGAQYVEIEEAVTIGFGASEFERQAAVSRNLVWDNRRLEPFAAPCHHVAVVGEARELRCLQDPASAVIVLGVALLLAVF